MSINSSDIKINPSDKKTKPKLKCSNCNKFVAKTFLEKHKLSRSCKQIITEEKTASEQLKEMEELKEKHFLNAKLMEEKIVILTQQHELNEKLKIINSKLLEI